MANYTDTSIQVPSVSGNTGPLLHHAQKNLGIGLVEEPLVVLARQKIVTGVYLTASAQLAIAAAAQNATATGFLWIMNPIANTTRNVRVRRIWGTTQHATALATPSAPRLVGKLFTFTGTPSGATLTPAKTASALASATIDIRTAVTGLTVSVVAALGSGGVAGALTAVGAYAPAEIEIVGPFGNEDEFVTLAAGEGIVVYQDTAGTTSDTRLANLNVLHDEIDIS